jgi:C-terminal processing protease CtpA/Prc
VFYPVASQDLAWVDRYSTNLNFTFQLPPQYEPVLGTVTRFASQEAEIDINPRNFASYSDTAIETLCLQLPTDSEVLERLDASRLNSNVVPYQDRSMCLITPINAQADAFGYAIIPYDEPQIFEWSVDPIYNLVLRAPIRDLSPIASSVNFPEEIDPQLYLRGAIDYMYSRSFYHFQIDWEQLEIEMMAFVTADGSTLEAAHRAILYALDQLEAVGDHHSYFRSPEFQGNLNTGQRESWGYERWGDVITLIYPGGPADLAGLRVGDVIETVYGVPFEDAPRSTQEDHLEFGIRRVGEQELLEITIPKATFDIYIPPIGQRLDSDIGYIELFGLLGGEFELLSQYATDAQNTIRELDTSLACGWIVDVRRHKGGRSGPFQVGIGPLSGEGEIYGTQRNTGEIDWIIYNDGALDGDRLAAASKQQLVFDPYIPHHLYPPIAVLISPQTGSAGELIPVILSNRSNAATRIFGEQSSGLTSSTIASTLFDGARMGITNAVLVDRSGQLYPDGIVPHEVIATDYTVYSTSEDPVIQAALEWLHEQPECKTEGSI